VQLDGARGIFPLVPDLLGESVRGTWGEPPLTRIEQHLMTKLFANPMFSICITCKILV
jgi:hypothetical protein